MPQSHFHALLLGLEQQLVVVGGDGQHHALPALPLELHHLGPLVLGDHLLAVPELLDQLELLLGGEKHLAAVLIKEDVLLAGVKQQLLLLLWRLNKQVLWLLLLYHHLLLLLLYHHLLLRLLNHHLLLRLNVQLLLALLLGQEELPGLLLTQHQSLLLLRQRLLRQEEALAPDVDDLTRGLPGGQLGGAAALDDLDTLPPLPDLGLGPVRAGDLDVGPGGNIEHGLIL